MITVKAIIPFKLNLFSLIKVLKNRVKKLALTLFHSLDQETWLDDSWELILQLLSHGKIQKCLTKFLNIHAYNAYNTRFS